MSMPARSVVIGILLQSTALYNEVKQHRPWLVLGHTFTMSISVDSSSDETKHRSPGAGLAVIV